MGNKSKRKRKRKEKLIKFTAFIFDSHDE